MAKFMILWPFFSSIQAQELPKGESPAEVGLGCVVRMQADSPILHLEHAEYSLRDDGLGPDKEKGDGIFSVFIPTMSQNQVDVQLWDRGELRWSGSVPLPPKGQQTWLSMDEPKEGARPIVHVAFQAIEESAKQNQTMAVYDSGYGIWMFLLVGIAIGWRLRLSPKTHIVRWVPLEHNPKLQTQVLVFETSSEASAILSEMLNGLQTLLCTSSIRRSLFSELAKKVPLYIGKKERYEASSLFAELSILEEMGPSVVLIDGVHALMAPLDSERSHAVLEEILGDSSHVVLLVFVGEPPLQGISISSQRDKNTR